jgi:hypothetical protein
LKLSSNGGALASQPAVRPPRPDAGRDPFSSAAGLCANGESLSSRVPRHRL